MWLFCIWFNFNILLFNTILVNVLQILLFLSFKKNAWLVTVFYFSFFSFILYFLIYIMNGFLCLFVCFVWFSFMIFLMKIIMFTTAVQSDQVKSSLFI